MKTFALRSLVALSLLALLAMGVDWLLYASDVANEILFGRADAWAGIRGAGSETMQYAMGAALVLLPIVTAATWVLFHRDDHITARAVDGDLIRLAPDAIERVVCREVRSNVAEVVKVGALAKQGRGTAAAITVHVAVSDRYSVPEVRDHVRKQTVATMERILGVADTGQVRVVVHDIKGAEGRSARKSAAPKNKKKPRRGKPTSKPAKTEIAAAKAPAAPKEQS